MKYLLIIFALVFLTGCAEFETKLEQMRCQPPNATACIGWETEI